MESSTVVWVGAWAVVACSDRVVVGCMAAVDWRVLLVGSAEVGRHYLAVVVLGAAGVVRERRGFVPPVMDEYQTLEEGAIFFRRNGVSGYLLRLRMAGGYM